MRGRKPARPRHRWFDIRYSQWGREYKSVCVFGDYESDYGTRGRVIKCAAAHVAAKHGVADPYELL